MPKTGLGREIKKHFEYDDQNIATCKYCTSYRKTYQISRQQVHLAQCTGFESIAEPAFLRKVRLTLPQCVAHTAHLSYKISQWRTLYGVDGIAEAGFQKIAPCIQAAPGSKKRFKSKRKRKFEEIFNLTAADSSTSGSANNDTEYNALNFAVASWAYKFNVPWKAIDSEEFKEIIKIAQPGDRLPTIRDRKKLI